jgi:LmbE family N-acetylglucosaminyl deacetylase
MKVLVAVAHPDDEVLLAGGAIAKPVAAGDRVLCSYYTDGVSARAPALRLAGTREKRRGEFEAAVARLGAEADGPPEATWDYDQRLDQVGVLDLAQATERLLGRFQPEVIYTHHPDDLNQDHKAVYWAVQIAARPYAGGALVRGIYGGEIPGVPLADDGRGGRRYVALTGAQLAAKMDALDRYKSERRDYPHPRSPEAVRSLAEVRGVECGRHAAEAFAVVWEVW